jgi:hypothetical protein
LSSEQAIEALRVVCGDLQIDARKTRPLFGRARLGLKQMRDRKPCAQGRAIAAVEQKKLVRQSVAQSAGNATLDVSGSRGAAETLAFD